MVCLDSLMIILRHHYVATLLAKMLILASFSQSMCTFFSKLTPDFISQPPLILDDAIACAYFFICINLRCTLRSDTISSNKSFKNDQRHFLLHLKRAFCSWDI